MNNLSKIVKANLVMGKVLQQIWKMLSETKVSRHHLILK